MVDAAKKGDDQYSRLTAAEMDFLDWYDLQDELTQAVTDLLISQASEKGNGFLYQFGINLCFADCLDIGFALAA